MLERKRDTTDLFFVMSSGSREEMKLLIDFNLKPRP
jgi:hypothetical protein